MTDYHSHNFYELYYLVKGERYYHIGSDIYKINEGTLVIIPPYVPHKTEGSVFNRYLISFERAFLDNETQLLLDDLCDKRVIVLNSKNNNHLQEILNELIIEYSSKRLYSEHIIRALTIKLMSLSLRHGNPIEQSKLLESTGRDTIGKILDYININIDKKLSLELISNKFYISKSHLSRLFKQTVKQNLSQYIIIVRLNYATRLIKTTDYSMQKIAELSGFNTSNYMNYVFLKHLNISPIKYRQNMA